MLGTRIPAASTAKTYDLRRAYFHAMTMPVQVEITNASAVAAKKHFIGSGFGAADVVNGSGGFGAAGFGASGFTGP